MTQHEPSQPATGPSASRPSPGLAPGPVLPESVTGTRPALRPIPDWVIAIGIPVMLLVAAGVVWLLLGIGVDGTKLDAIRTGGTLGVGLGGVLVLWLGIRRQRSTELDLLAKYEAHELAERTAANALAHQQQTAADTRHDAAERRITELYTKAADQLGSDKAAVRLAGLYALERLAQNTLEQREAIGNVLCAYLRMPFPRTDGVDQDFREAHDKAAQEREVRQTALDILTRHSSSDRPALYWPEINIRLQRAFLVGMDLAGASLVGADLHGADLGGASLHGANLRRADLGGAHLVEAKLTGADLDAAHLAGANLAGANLVLANLRGANLAEATLVGADLQEADLARADLSGTDLDEQAAHFRSDV